MKKVIAVFATIVITALAGYFAWQHIPAPQVDDWTASEKNLIRAMSISQLGEPPPDPSNQYADNEMAAFLGQALYFDTRLSGNGTISCATCHKPELNFTDGLPLAVASAAGTRHTPGLAGLSYSPWFYWDGRKDSQWAQALAPLEAPHEHDIDRLSVARLVTSDADYSNRYRTLFGAPPPLPDLAEASPLGRPEFIAGWNQLDEQEKHNINSVFTNVGKAIAAYQRKLLPGRSRFDDYADSLSEEPATAGEDILNASELAGLDIFLNKGQCISCHNGPLLTNFEFHNTGVMVVTGQLPPMGRYDGIRIARDDPFNCKGRYSDAGVSDCIELEFARDTNELVGAHKTPGLRNVADTAPYMHGGQIATLSAVIDHYNEAPVSMLSHNEAKPLALRSVEARQLEAFLRTLSAPLATAEKWLRAPESP